MKRRQFWKSLEQGEKNNRYLKMYPNHVFFPIMYFTGNIWQDPQIFCPFLSSMTRHDSDPSPNVDIQIKKRYFDVLTKVNDEMKSIALHRSTELQLFSRVTSQTLNFKSEL